MAFTTNYEDNGFDLLPEGKYECIIRSAFLNATKGGTEYFSVDFIIRNDVAQKYQNRHIFYPIWRRKPDKRTGDDEKVDGFSFKQIMSLAKAARLEKGKSYDSLNALGDDLKNKCVLVTLEHNEYNGEINERVQYTNESRHPECRHIMKTKQAAAIEEAAPEEEAEPIDDLPF